jgi:acyl-phosphate glycerol 3-phosphate acyltransferase
MLPPGYKCRGMIQPGALLPPLLGYLLGSVPFGYLIGRAFKGIDIRRYGSHNIGATNVLRVVGPFPALLTLLLDIGKGLAPVWLAAQPWWTGSAGEPWLVVASAVAAILGHAYSAWFYLRERQFSRGKAVAAALGADLGFLVIGAVPPIGVLVPLAVFIAIVFGPRLFSRRFGFVSLGSILASVVTPLLWGFLGVAVPYQLFAGLAFLFITWKHKENLGRILDGTEPRLGEKPPLAGLDEDEVACAFMIHPMTPDDWWQTRRFSSLAPVYRAGLLPQPIMERLMREFKPMKLDEIRGIETADGRRARVYLLAAPLLPRQIKENPELAVRRAIQGALMARDLGASVFGLGAYWSVVGNKGEDVQAKVDIPVTNGGAYTAGTVKAAVPAMLRRLEREGRRADHLCAGVVGANGVVGFRVCHGLLGQVGRLVMIGRDVERLERSAARLRHRAGTTEIVTTTSMDALLECDLVFTATSEPDPVIFPAHVRPGALIYDLGRPADVDESVRSLPGVEVVPGGTVRPPGVTTGRLDIHFGRGSIPACLAETIIIALERCPERRTLGDNSRAENVEFFVQKAEELGFVVVDRMGEPAPAAPLTGARVTTPAPAASTSGAGDGG